jgi:excisionase family DNA binding protein
MLKFNQQIGPTQKNPSRKPNMANRILTAEQVAKVLQVHHLTVLKLIKQKKLKASKVGRVYRIRESAIDDFLDKYSN